MTNPGEPNFPEPSDTNGDVEGVSNGVPNPSDAPPPMDASFQNVPMPVSPPAPSAVTPQANPVVNSQYVQPIPGADKKIAAGICGILVGSLGIHKFVLGYNNEGIIMLVVTVMGFVLSCFFLPILGSTAMWVIGLVEGIMYLTKTDQEFVDTYVNGRKPWF